MPGVAEIGAEFLLEAGGWRLEAEGVGVVEAGFDCEGWVLEGSDYEVWS